MKLEYDFLYLGVGKAEHLLTELDTRNNRDFGDA
ncbi:MAG: hypothetical protein RLZZ475_2536, partial [Pseudomonadota bacterium]